MRFGPVAVESAIGAILAHAQKLPDGRIAKGTRIGPAEIERLRAADIALVVAAMLDAGDVGEDEAAGQIAEALASSRIGAAPAATGRANLFAGENGLFLPDRATIDRLNRLDPGITLATLGEFAPVEADRMVATVKIIPLAVPGAAVEAAVALLRGRRALKLAPFRARGVGLVQTELPTVKASVLDKTRDALASRLEKSESWIEREVRCHHSGEPLAQALVEAAADEDLTIVFGASAVIDADDVIPAAIRAAGGDVEHLGMPVDPGNLLLLGRIGTRIVLGAPGCARSPRENGFDWILNRILADLPVTREDVTGLGVGGLLMEIASRPQPRDAPANPAADPAPRVEIVVLAAGRSSRMNGPNKLLATFDGVPLIRRSVETALASRAARVHVVTGHMRDAITSALDGLDVGLVANPDYADGLATSLKAGFEAAAGTADGVLVLLADQPLLTAGDLDRMIAEFRPSGEGAIVLAADGGRRANPVILSSRFRDEVAGLAGDIGARSIVQAHRDLVTAVEIGAAASFDVDTPDLMARAGGILASPL
ncbi:NTP transferase domain-containing protein [Aureimonas sp. AU12]|uniref:NTP transferase domain-containing protein n=1 Tax=Aureimonas sp. AU12 TaxID=1638161 RepID=UPI000783B54A|nr:molybdopterin-binding/glycosyltransferase family 2 protein [Aureimonas sp. AU12]